MIPKIKEVDNIPISPVTDPEHHRKSTQLVPRPQGNPLTKFHLNSPMNFQNNPTKTKLQTLIINNNNIRIFTKTLTPQTTSKRQGFYHNHNHTIPQTLITNINNINIFTTTLTPQTNAKKQPNFQHNPTYNIPQALITNNYSINITT